MKIGILGGGQLGRMLALAAAPLGMRVRVYDPAPAPAAIAAEHVAADWEDREALDRFAAGLDVVTWEFENVPLEAVEHLAARVQVWPPALALRRGQDRWEEKRMFARLGIAVPPFAAVDDRADLDRAVAEIGLPLMLKTRRFGYDGKGQAAIRDPKGVDAAWSQLQGRPLIAEQWVDFSAEVSVIAARNRHRAVATYPLARNVHHSGILEVSLVSPEADPLLPAAQDLIERLLVDLDYVGVLAVELFLAGGRLYANEIAPRVHNTGHFSIEGAETSQFENHLRAIAGWPLGSPRPRGWSMMANLIGTLPPPEAILSIRGAHLHDYGKRAAPGRKLGHVTITAADRAELEARAAELTTLVPALGPSVRRAFAG
jgi:5-(carboxyamino)imidazole ribonucleotide synthase